MRIGLGYDSHKLGANRKLILGGVNVPYKLGLIGHSDADVLIHAVSDAILGAMGKRDIGYHYPDSSLKYKDISSLIFLKDIKNMISKTGYLINNIDSTIIAQQPRLSDFIPSMIENIAKTLEINMNLVNVKATTTEGMGYTGRGEGICAQAVVLLTKNRATYNSNISGKDR